MDLVQVSFRSGRVTRVARGQTPVIDLALMPHQSVVSFSLKAEDQYLSRRSPDDLGRKTVDWDWSAYIATRC